MDGQLWHIVSYRLIFGLLAILIIGYELLPLGLAETRLPAPDWLLVLTLAWLLRQPGIISIGVIVAVFLLADFLLQRPPGLMTAAVLVVSEWLRSRRTALTEVNFLVEWGSVAAAVLGILILQRFVLWLIVAPQVSLGLSLIQALATILAYPLVVLISHYIFGVRKLPLADAEPL